MLGRSVAFVGLLVSFVACTTTKADKATEASATPATTATSSSTGGAQQQPLTASAANPLATGKQTVRGGETFELREGIRVGITRVTYLDEPCPKGETCVHSGVIKTVSFSVQHGSEKVDQNVAAHTSRVIGGVLCRVLEVRAPGEADIEAQLPVTPVP